MHLGKTILSLLGLALLTALPAAADDSAFVPTDPVYEMILDGRLDEALEAIEGLEGNERYAARYAYYEGLIALRRMDARTGVDRLERATELAPRNANYQFWLGNAYVKRMRESSTWGKLTLAPRIRRAWERAITLDPHHLTARENLIEYHLEAPGVVGGNVRAARDQAEEIERRDRRRGSIALARIQYNTGQPDLARATFRQALAAYPNDAELRYEYARFLRRQQAWPDALAEIDTALERARNGANREMLLRCQFEFGSTAALSGRDLDRGADYLRRYIKGNPAPHLPDLATAHVRLGIILERTGQEAAAEREYRAALRIDPGHKEARKALAKARRA